MIIIVGVGLPCISLVAAQHENVLGAPCSDDHIKGSACILGRGVIVRGGGNRAEGSLWSRRRCRCRRIAPSTSIRRGAG